METWYLLGKGINFIPIKNEWEKVSDLDGFIYVWTKDSKSSPWVDSEDAKENHEQNKNNFKDKLITQLKRYLNG